MKKYTKELKTHNNLYSDTFSRKVGHLIDKIKDSETLVKNLEVDETLGQLLVSEGFTGIEEIAQSTPEDISKIDRYL